MARNKKASTSSPSASPPRRRKPRTPSPKKMASVKTSPENKEVSKATQHQNNPAQKKAGAKAVLADSRGASKSPENKNPNNVKTAANVPENNNNKSAVGCEKCKKCNCSAKEEQVVAKGPVDNKPVAKHDNHHNKPIDTKAQSNKTSPSISEDELERIFPSFKKDRELAAASFGRLLYDTFDEVSKASGSKGLEASRWASPSTEASRSTSGKREPVDNQHQKGRSPRRNDNKNTSNNTSVANSPPRRNDKKNNSNNTSAANSPPRRNDNKNNSNNTSAANSPPRRNINKNTSSNTSATNSPSPRGRTGYPANRKAMTPPHTVAPIIDTPATIAAEKEAARVGRILFDAFNDLSKTSVRAGLEASRWAVTADDTPRKNTESVKKAPAVTEKKETPAKTALPQKVMDVDNTSAFLAALRARTAAVAKKPDAPLAKDTKDIVADSPKHGATTPTKLPEAAFKVKSQESSPSGSGAMKHPAGPVSSSPSGSSASKVSSPFSKGPVTGVMENREHLAYFSSWGTPAPRTRSPAQVRRIILSPIPDFLASPNKVLSLVHGGRVESVQYFPKTKSAHVLFCDPAASKKYYNAYPNGIEVDVNGRKAVVFVDQYKEVDVVSSRLEESLALGATRVVRAVGADLTLSMQSLAALAEERRLKLEKIVDVFDGSSRTRTVSFRLCSIEQAVRLRAALVRHEEWEQANVQYGPDPCEFASGIHWE